MGHTSRSFLITTLNWVRQYCSEWRLDPLWKSSKGNLLFGHETLEFQGWPSPFQSKQSLFSSSQEKSWWMNALREEYAVGKVARSCKGARAGRAMLRLEKRQIFEGRTVVLFGTGDTHGRALWHGWQARSCVGSGFVGEAVAGMARVTVRLRWSSKLDAVFGVFIFWLVGCIWVWCGSLKSLGSDTNWCICGW